MSEQRLIDANELKEKVFDIIDHYDSGEYICIDEGKYILGNDIENETRRILSLNEAVQFTINCVSTVLTISEKPTNGDIQQAMFPKAVVEDLQNGMVRVDFTDIDYEFYRKEWWNASYQS